MSASQARLHAALGTGELFDDAAAAAWADGYGVVAPDVARYVEVLRGVPDPVLLAMLNVAATSDVELIDPDTATLLALHARAQRPLHVLEVGTGIGYLTLQLARAVPDDCTITSFAIDPIRQGQAHAFLARDEVACATELRLGDAVRVLEAEERDEAWDMVVLTDSRDARLDIIDAVTPHMAPGALLAVPWALRGGRVADGEQAWNGNAAVEQQRVLNRCIATDPRFTDVALLPVGDGLLLARRV